MTESDKEYAPEGVLYAPNTATGSVIGGFLLAALLTAIMVFTVYGWYLVAQKLIP